MHHRPGGGRTVWATTIAATARRPFTSTTARRPSPTAQSAQSLGHGIELWPQGGILANNRFQDLAATKYAIAYDAIDTFPSVSGNRLTGGGIPGVYVARGTVTGTQRWNQPGAGLDLLPRSRS